MAIELVLALALLLANAFIVAVEFSVVRLRPTQADQFLRERRPGAVSAKHAVEHVDAYLSACQLGITMASLGLGALGEPAFHDLLEPVLGEGARVAGLGLASALAFLLITTLHVVVGELSPKSLAIARTPVVVLTLAPLMRAFYLATKPLVDLLNALGNLLLKPFGVPPASEVGHTPHTEDELRELLRESRREGLIEREEQELSETALVFGDIRTREVMKPRTEIDFVVTSDTPRHVVEVAIASGRTRLPLCEPEGGVDAAIGTVNVKDLLPLAAGRDEVDLRAVARPLGHFAESARIDDVLGDMRRERTHIALVHDEHGTVIGLLTLEDVIEELVGDIEDEFDPRGRELVRSVGGRLRIEGETPLRTLARRVGLALEDQHEATVGGYVAQRLGRVPRVGEVVSLDGVWLEVCAVEGTRITEFALVDEPSEQG